ncbi:hypothetical protein ACHAWT_010168 [Skeletonema menzelii]
MRAVLALLTASSLLAHFKHIKDASRSLDAYYNNVKKLSHLPPLSPPKVIDRSKNDTNVEIRTFINNNAVNLSGIYFPALDENGKPGYVHDATTLHTNPPAFDFKGVNCGPNDATMQMMTQRVYVDLAAHERVNKLGKTPRSKIFCHVYTTNKQRIRIQAIRETWGHRCDGFHAASTVTDRSIDSVSIPHEGKEEYGNMWQKVRAMWSYVYVHYFDSYDWFHIGGDDMYVLVENLRLYLESEDIVTASNGGEHPLLLGQQFYQDGYMNASYVTGGGGYTLNKAALKALVTSFPHCEPNLVSSTEDVLVTRCLRNEGVEAYCTADETGAERYNHFDPEMEFNYDPKKNPLLYYSYSSNNTNIGPERVVKNSVSFHLKSGGMDGQPKVENLMRRVHAILYGHCTNSTLGPPVPTKQWRDGKFLKNYWKRPQFECDLKAKPDEICNCSRVKYLQREVEVCKKVKKPKSFITNATSETATTETTSNNLFYRFLKYRRE